MDPFQHHNALAEAILRRYALVIAPHEAQRVYRILVGGAVDQTVVEGRDAFDGLLRRTVIYRSDLPPDEDRVPARTPHDPDSGEGEATRRPSV